MLLIYKKKIYIHKILTKTYGTLGYYINSIKNDDSFLTTPDYEILKQTAFLKKKNLYNYIFEASSQGLDQNRLKNFPINIAAIIESILFCIFLRNLSDIFLVYLD